MINPSDSTDLGRGLWYLDQVFPQKVFAQLKAEYRERATEWELAYPNRISSKYRNKAEYTFLWDTANDIRLDMVNFVGYNVHPISQEVFIDLPGHKLSWHYDNDNFKVLLHVYMGEVPLPGAGTHWYTGDHNDQLYQTHGANTIVPVTGLSKIETAFVPNAGYVNDNTQKKAHGTNSVLPGTVRESLLFLFG